MPNWIEIVPTIVYKRQTLLSSIGLFMFPRAFDYFSPYNLAEALDLIKSADAETRILAGGQSLLPAMKARKSLS